MSLSQERKWWMRNYLTRTNLKKSTTIGLKKYLDTTTDWMLQLVNTLEEQMKNSQLVKKKKK